MLKYIILFFSVMSFLSACTQDKTPAGIISEPRMVNLLTEVHIIDGGIYTIPQAPDSLYKYGLGKYLALFKRYRTDSVEFKRSMNYYAMQPAELLKMYDQITLILKQKTDSLNKIQYKQHAVSK